MTVVLNSIPRYVIIVAGFVVLSCAMGTPKSWHMF